MIEKDMITEIQDLKRQMGSFNDRMIGLRYEDFKEVFIEQMRQVIKEEGRRYIEDDLLIMNEGSECQLKQQCTQSLEDVVERSIEAFGRDDYQSALEMLTSTRSLICNDGSPCLDDDCSRVASESLGKIRSIMLLYIKVANGMEVDGKGPFTGPSTIRAHEISPEDTERMLSPLSNALRIRVLRMLTEEDHSLSEISRKLDLKTGHLLFHIRALKENDFISTDRKNKRYSLTIKGRTAMRCLDDMMGKLIDAS
jgi:DNA-binding MarR family transcriptional regulator